MPKKGTRPGPGGLWRESQKRALDPIVFRPKHLQADRIKHLESLGYEVLASNAGCATLRRPGEPDYLFVAKYGGVSRGRSPVTAKRVHPRDLEAAIHEKMARNRARPHRHGGKRY